MTPKRRKEGPQKMESPLDAKMREIAEREAKNRAAMDECNKVINEAPQRAEKIAKARRDELITRASRTETRRGSRAALPDHWRLEGQTAAPVRHKRLRAERRQGRLLFFALLPLAVGLGYYVYYTITHS
jgi:hypothetical protein